MPLACLFSCCCDLIKSCVSFITSFRSNFSFISSSLFGSVVRAASTCNEVEVWRSQSAAGDVVGGWMVKRERVASDRLIRKVRKRNNRDSPAGVAACNSASRPWCLIYRKDEQLGITTERENSVLFLRSLRSFGIAKIKRYSSAINRDDSSLRQLTSARAFGRQCYQRRWASSLAHDDASQRQERRNENLLSVRKLPEQMLLRGTNHKVDRS